MVQDWLNTYKYGWKTSYYQNTYDTSNDGVEEEEASRNSGRLTSYDGQMMTTATSCKI